MTRKVEISLRIYLRTIYGSAVVCPGETGAAFMNSSGAAVSRCLRLEGWLATSRLQVAENS